MRDLMSKQKKLLDQWYQKNWIKIQERGGGLWWEPSDDAFSADLYEQLQAINDTEILYQNITRYIVDKIMSEKRNYLAERRK